MPSAIVIGAGVFGASLADRLAREGWEVTLVDRFEPGHARAESGGETRLIRCSHGPDGFYARSARRALELWRELGEGVLVESGVAWFARREDGWEADSERVLRALGIPVERLSPDEGARLFPSLAVDDLAFVLHEPEAGVLRAADGVRALVRRAREAGARLVIGEARPAGAVAAVDGRTLEADVVIWACGAWLRGLFPELRAHAGHASSSSSCSRRRPSGTRPAGSTSTPPSTDTRAWRRTASRSARTWTASRWIPTRGRSRPTAEAVATAREYLAHALPRPGRRAAWRARPAATTASRPTASSSSPAIPSTSGVWLLGGGSGHGFKHGPALAEHVAAVLAGRGAARAALRARRARAPSEACGPPARRARHAAARY